MNFQELNKIITRYGLKPASQRNLSLFTLSCVGLAYVRLIKSVLGYSFKVVGGLGDVSHWKSMLNEEYISRKTGEAIRRTRGIEKIFFKTSQEIYKKAQVDFKKAKKLARFNPYQAMSIVCDFQPRYMMSIGIYNCFWRFFGNSAPQNNVERKFVSKVARERDLISKMYPEAEKLIIELLGRIGKKMKVKKDILGCLTLPEMHRILKSGRLPGFLRKRLMGRQKEYFYLIENNPEREVVLTDLRVIEKVRQKFFVAKRSAKQVHGFAAYPGRIIGKVFIAGHHRALPPPPWIFVASATHPQDIVLIKKCSAIVTDEGGILSHAAIIARELKKPCIISTKIATQVFKDGDMVEVDANKRVVRKI